MQVVGLLFEFSRFNKTGLLLGELILSTGFILKADQSQTIFR